MKILTCLLLLFVCQHAFAQQGDKRVLIFEDNFKRPQRAVAFVMLSPGKKNIAGITDTAGRFLLPDTIHAPLTLQLKDTAFTCRYCTVAADKPETRIVIIPGSTQQLKEVSITAAATYTKGDAAKITMDLTKIPEARFWTIAAALKNIPGVEVDANGNITYAGKPVALKHNGYTSVVFSKMLSDNIHQQPALKYTGITLQLHDLKTEKPTLNFEQVLPADKSIYGNINTYVSTVSGGADGSITARTGKHTISAMGGYSRRYTPEKVMTGNTHYDTSAIVLTRETRTTGTARITPFISISDNYRINDRHFLNAEFSWNASDDHKNEEAVTRIRHQDVLLKSVTATRRTDMPFADNNNLNTRLAYIWKIPAKIPGTRRRLDISAEYVSIGTGLENSLVSAVDQGKEVPADNYRQRKKEREKDVYAYACYAYENKRVGAFDIAAKYFYRTYEERQETDFSLHPQEPELLQSTAVYHYGALLASLEKKFGSSFSARAVLKGDYNYNGFKHLPDRYFRSFFVSPYLSLYYQLPNKGTLRLESEYSQQRPPLHALVNVPMIFNNGYAVKEGNPDLRPSGTFSVNAGYAVPWKKLRFNLDASYRRISNDIGVYTYARDSVTVVSYRNLQAVNGYYTRGMLSDIPLAWKLKAGISGWVEYYRYHVRQDYNTNGFSRGASLSLTCMINAQWRLMVSGSYDKRIGFQHTSPDYFSSNINAVYAKGKWMCSLTGSNLHQPWLEQRSSSNGEGYYALSADRYRNFDCRLSLSYTFGKNTTFTDKGKYAEKNDLGSLSR
ncbi:outer membrane beta-barrel protein [Chitinophaga solisilvae]|uniref:outer membrane beta-barrel protein n=1 Tax=Chitinophaga solisilvae TaxID=1233460 RepID=UPI00136C6FBE|nr:outer membrane beta-barrel protein [Chitinophaga solisilvae]